MTIEAVECLGAGNNALHEKQKPQAEDMVHCSRCGKDFNSAAVERVGDGYVCPDCRAHINAGACGE